MKTKIINYLLNKQWILSVVRFTFIFLVKWIILKPIMQLSFIINGKVSGKINWHQKKYNGVITWKWLNRISYKLTKYVMFFK